MALAHKLNHDGVWGSVSFLSGSPRGCGRLQGFRGKPMMAIVQPGGQKADRSSAAIGCLAFWNLHTRATQSDDDDAGRDKTHDCNPNFSHRHEIVLNARRRPNDTLSLCGNGLKIRLPTDR